MCVCTGPATPGRFLDPEVDRDVRHLSAAALSESSQSARTCRQTLRTPVPMLYSTGNESPTSQEARLEGGMGRESRIENSSARPQKLSPKEDKERKAIEEGSVGCEEWNSARKQMDAQSGTESN